MGLPPRDFKSLASANSATPATSYLTKKLYKKTIEKHAQKSTINREISARRRHVLSFSLVLLRRTSLPTAGRLRGNKRCGCFPADRSIVVFAEEERHSDIRPIENNEDDSRRGAVMHLDKKKPDKPAFFLQSDESEAIFS